MEKWYFCGSPLLSLCVSTRYLSSRSEARDLHLLQQLAFFRCDERLVEKEGKFWVGNSSKYLALEKLLP
jgi:hypothetical protein